MSTYLQLFQKTVRNCGIKNVVPTAVTGQTGDLLQIVSWITDAWTELQNSREDWRWMRKKFTLVTSSGDDTYAFSDCTDVDDAAAISRFNSWRLSDVRNPPKMYLTSDGVAGETILTYTAWDNFEYLYKTGSLQSQTSRPVHISVDPANNIRLGITPDDSYTITGTYQRSEQVLSANADTPEMPGSYHDLIMYQVMEWYGLEQTAPEVLVRAERGMRRLRRQLSKNQLEKLRITGSMA